MCRFKIKAVAGGWLLFSGQLAIGGSDNPLALFAIVADINQKGVCA
jgi:hypothetical protein